MPGHVNRAIILVEPGDDDGASAAARTALRLDPNNPEAHDQFGFVLRAKNNLDGAIAELREAVRLRPADAHRQVLCLGLLRLRGHVFEGQRKVIGALRPLAGDFAAGA